MKRFLLVASIIVSVFFLSRQAKAQGTQTVVSGNQTTTVNFPSGGCGYKWVNNTPGIGLAASGSGDIPAFTAVNTGSTPITATISVTPVASSFAYVANYGSNNVSVVNTVDKNVIATIPVGAGPYGVSVNTSGTLVYVTNQTDNSVSVINTTSNTVTATIPIGLKPDGVVVSPDSKRAYVANYGSNTVSVIDATTNNVLTTIPVGVGPLGITESPDGSHVYVTNVTASTMSVISTSTNSVITTVPCGWLPEGITVNADGSLIYVAVWGLNQILILNATDYSKVKYIQMVANPFAIALSPDGTKAYVSGSGYFTTIFLSDDETMTTAATASNGISVTPDGASVFSLDYYGVLDVDVLPYYSYHEIAVGNNPVSLGNFIANGPGCNSSPFTYTITVKPLAVPPVITTSTATGTISACQGSPSASPDIEQFTVSGTGLTSNITATAPAGFEVSLLASSGYGNTVTITQSGGTASNITVYVRSAASATGSISGNVTLSSQGANTQNVAVVGKINPLPTVNNPGNQTVSAGSSTTAINFTGTANTFNWTNNNPAIGLPASGTGTIPAFTAVNNGATPITATITVMPQSVSYAYVANSADNTVSIVNTATNTVIATLNVGKYPTGVSVSPDGSRAYVTDQGDNTVSIINTITNKVIATIPVGLGPWGIAISPDGSKIFVANTNGNSVSVINATTGLVINTIPVNGPWELAISPDGTRLYVSNPLPISNSNAVTEINTTTNKVIATIIVGLQPNGLAVSPDGSKVYVACENSNKISIINTLTNTVDAQLSTPTPAEVVLSPDGSRLYVSNNLSDEVSIFDTSTKSLITEVPITRQPYGLSLNKDGSLLYVTILDRNNVSILNTSNYTFTASVPVGNSPWGLGNFITNGSGCSGIPVTFTITINPTPPSITTTAVTGIISACEGSPSENPNIAQFTVSGNSLSNNIVVTAPSGFEVSLSATGGYGNSVTIPQSAGVVNDVTVYVRSAASATGNISGNVTLSSQGANSQNIAVTGEINPLPTVNPVPNQVVVSGSLTSRIHFTGTATNYNWAADNNIGTPNSSGPDIAPFIATNTGSTPLISTFIVTPVNLTTGCSGTTITFTIEVDPLLPASVTTTGTLSSLSTIYGTASTSTSFTVSGTNINTGILVTPPAGFEVSTDNTNFNSTVTVGTSGTINATKVYIRLTSKTPVGTYSGNTVLSSVGATGVNVPVPISVVTPAPLTITANNVQKRSGQTLTNGFVPTGFTSNGLQNSESIGNVLMTYGEGADASSKVGTYTGSVTPSNASGGSFDPKNYTITYKSGDIIVTESPAGGPVSIPNAFTPNGDGINDVWNIKSLIDYPSCMVSIFTRYGSMIYQSRGYAKPWDGNYNNNPLPTGTYYYIINLQNGQPPLSGWVALIR
ncbi:MAG TPA: beta-propeller fold lactonase family protein [Mucilaginibacter sp.]